MKISQWEALFQEIKSGEHNYVHDEFPDPEILAMRITNTGVEMMIVNVDKNSEKERNIFEFDYRPAATHYTKVDYFANSEPYDAHKSKGKGEKSNVKTLFKKRKKKKVKK